ncbi:MAG: sigma-70 family RNA polymerase sigma factor [Actinomycetota bacterium]|nr:sigma-70 family RNA polymerase sigma factor [Actinomycetota bacterium]
MTADAVDFFLQRIGAVPLLRAEQEVELGQRVQAGALAARRLASGELVALGERAELERMVEQGDAAREQMIQANLRLVVSVARRYLRSGVPLLDLVQDGTLGLMRAVDKFDPERGTKFSTYASWWIRQAVTRGMADSMRTVRLPVAVLTRLNSCLGRRHELMAVWGREPTNAELARACGLTEADVTALLGVSVEPVSLDGDAERGEFGIGDNVADRHDEGPEEAAGAAVEADWLRAAMWVLDPLEWQVLRLRYGFVGEPVGATAVAESLGVTRERIRHLEGRALRKLSRAPGVASTARSGTR